MATYHKSNMGKFGNSLIVDIDGYTHTTPEEWAQARMDWGFEAPTSEQLTDLADRSVIALEAAEKLVAEWRQGPDLSGSSS